MSYRLLDAETLAQYLHRLKIARGGGYGKLLLSTTQGTILADEPWVTEKMIDLLIEEVEQWQRDQISRERGTFMG